ncbi:chemotaxis protein CheB [Adhaeribacter pallidiroseus]|uniref:protein-glutamate methylesterase n=1 Tax=Adhaeribacter pallidiroseus TaxID=2072847 RepID=A0A369QIZ0_9BACT|nr:chemotaxis protein CheB [Adhaeribacter pallidiroseus]RDC63196.1 Protein-glutamate methylesterase [Adhaeribacter pallidiroseus]
MLAPGHNIIVIGTSAGGMEALCKLLDQLPEKLPAAIFIVQHLSMDSSSDYLVKRMAKHTKLQVKVAENDEVFQRGTVYMVPADRHLLLTNKRILVAKGPRENQFRPAVDPLFRSAAAYHGSRVIGVILTGMMNDGTVGMDAVKRSGGITVVQDPDDAEHPDMPRNALRNVSIDYVVPIREMGALLYSLSQTPSGDSITVPQDILNEAQMVERIMTNGVMSDIKKMDDLGERSGYSCPDCGGGLWEINQGTVKRYRCHSGHAYNEESLFNSMNSALEETLWVSMRIMEERRNMLESMANMERSKGQSRWAVMQQERAEEMKIHVERLKEILLNRNSVAHNLNMRNGENTPGAS